MNIDLAKNISELLFKHETVIFPGFGGIVTGYKSASIDYVQGLIYPPSKKLTFNEKLTINDGVLERFVREQYDLGKEEAQQAVGVYVTKIQVSLEKGELVFFPKVGRLYRNYERKLQFLQDNTNYNTETFGMPPVQFYPILRSKDGLIKEAPVPVEQHQMVGTRSGVARWAQGMMPLLIGFAILGIALTLFMLRPDEILEENVPSKIPVAQRLNKKPAVMERAGILNLDNTTEVKTPEKVEATKKEEIVADDDEKTYESDFEAEAILRAAAQKKCIIIVGAFSKKAGVQKTVDKIYNHGFDAYQDKKKGLTRVGVQFSYENEKEIESILKNVRKSIHYKAWIYKQ